MKSTAAAQHLLTIAIPTYNGSKTISDMLDILLPQCDERVEVLISDNCSTDNTPDIIEKYREIYPQIRYVKNEKNLGADGNFLQCMKIADGKFTMLISDDDIIVENGVEKILDYITAHPDVQLAYLDTIAFKDKYKSIDDCHRYTLFSDLITADVDTTDKTEFLAYAQRLWGFTSVYVWNTERFHTIKNPEQYIGTYFLQSYIHMHCSDRTEDHLGVIKGPCVAIGEYGIIGNYDTAEVEGVFYKRMISEAVECGYPYKKLMAYYVWKLRFLVSRAIIKEKVAGVYKTKKNSVLEATKGLFFTRIYLLLFYNIPPVICKYILTTYRKMKKASTDTYVNRPT